MNPQATSDAGTHVESTARTAGLSPKPLIQRVLRRLGLHERLRASRVYDWYWSVFDPTLIARRRAEVEFYRNTLVGLRPGDLIFDVGANDGTKSDVFLRLGARVVAVEPDARNVETIRAKFHTLRVRQKPLHVVAKAVSDSDRPLVMWVDTPGSAQNTFSDKWVSILRGSESRFGQRFEFANQRTVQATTLDQLMNQYGVPHYIKIDVEGFEPAVVRGLRRAVRFVSFEVNLPEFREEGAECVSLLHALDAAGSFNFSADYGRGVALDRWLDKSEFLAALEACPHPSIEVFWRTT